MAGWRQILSGFVPTRVRTYFVPEELSRLLTIPPEILLSVIDYLPPEALACLALSNRHLSQMLGARAWQALPITEGEARFAFLSLLSRDLPVTWVCYPCKKLHYRHLKRFPITWRYSGYGCDHEHTLAFLWRSYFSIRLSHVELALKRHRLGMDHGISVNFFTCTEVVEPKLPTEVTNLLSVDANIMSNELFVRVQQWTLVPQDKRYKLANKPLINSLCWHTNFQTAIDYQPNHIPRLVQSQLDQLQTGSAQVAVTRSCEYCFMDFEMVAKDFGDRGVAIVLTRWLNLGSGADPRNAKWYSHFSIPRLNGSSHVPHQVGAIRQVFEGSAAHSISEVTDKNNRKLFSPRKESSQRDRGEFVWRYVCDQTWYLVEDEML